LMRRALMWLNLYGWETDQRKLKNRQKMQFLCFCPYVGQPHDHIGWATSLPFASINPINPRTNPWNFHNFFLRIGDFEKLSFFELAILLHPHENQSKLLNWVSRMGQNLYDYPGLQQKSIISYTVYIQNSVKSTVPGNSSCATLTSPLYM
jgi:hypothetical protein